MKNLFISLLVLCAVLLPAGEISAQDIFGAEGFCLELVLHKGNDLPDLPVREGDVVATGYVIAKNTGKEFVYLNDLLITWRGSVDILRPRTNPDVEERYRVVFERVLGGYVNVGVFPHSTVTVKCFRVMRLSPIIVPTVPAPNVNTGKPLRIKIWGNSTANTPNPMGFLCDGIVLVD